MSECENIHYRATLSKANPLDDTICAFSGGTFSLTTPDGVVHIISSDVLCIGGNTGLEGCFDGVDSLASDIIDYTVSPADVVGGSIKVTAQYANGVVHDSANNTGGVSATSPHSDAVVFCDDGDPCTTDTCDPLVGCQHTEGACDLCDNAPRTGCKHATVPLKAQLRLKNSSDDRADLVQFKWLRGEATQVADFGHPDTGDAYALCVYAPDTPSPSLVMHLEVPASGVCGTKACWRALNTKGFLYRDSTGRNAGITKILLKAGADGKAQAQLQGKGTSLPPVPSPFALPATVQLQSTNGQCWEAQFSRTGELINTAAQFKGRADAAP